MRIPNTLIIAALILSACDTAPLPHTPALRAQAQSEAEIAYVKDIFNSIQPRSIAENREYCGYIGLDPTGQMATFGPFRGGVDGCVLRNPPKDLRLIASYHTHAGYDLNYDNEVPSSDDLEGDIIDGVDGYVATPGGRVWFNNANIGRATLLCDLGCVIADPGFVPDYAYPVLSTYRLDGLRARQG